MSILDWEIDALYHRRLQKQIVPDIAAEDVLKRIQDMVMRDDRDTRLFLGNIVRHPDVFTIVGFWYPKKSRISPAQQGDLPF